jgi:hypothetical protein
LYLLKLQYDSNRSSLSQLVTRYTRYGRFIRRHLFCLGPITHCQLVLGQPDCVARPGAGRHVPPGSHAYAGPNRDDAGGECKSRPPHASRAVTVTTRSPAATQRTPRGPRARRAKRGLRDSADRASWARLPARRAVLVRERSRAGPPIVEHGPGPARARGGAQWCGPRAGTTPVASPPRLPG